MGWLDLNISRSERSFGAGFSNQQALLVLLIVFPVGVVALGFAFLFIQRQGSITPRASSPPAQTASPNTAERPTTIQQLPSRKETSTA